MPLETGTYIDDLVATNPPASDGLAQGDDHIRLIKALIKATFPNIDGAVNPTPAELNQLSAAVRTLGLANGSVGSPSLYFDSDTDLGLYRVSANTLGIAGRLSGDGAKDPGEICSFPFVPSSMATGGTAVGTERYIELDGSVYNIATFPVVGALLGATYGGNGVTTFGVPNCKTTGRFLRSRTGSVAVGTSQSNVIKNHVHPLSGGVATGSAASGGAHTHTVTVTDPGHTHTFTAMQAGGVGAAGGSSGANSTSSTTNSNTTGITASADSGGAHTHGLSGSTDNNTSGDATETRPEAFVVVMCLKT